MKKLKKIILKLFNEREETVEHLKWILNLSKGFRKYIWGFLVLSGSAMIISLVSSVASKYVVDAATGYTNGIFYKYLIVMAATSICSLITSIFSTFFNNYVSEKFSFSIRAEMFNRVQRGKWFNISSFHSGDILVRLTDDVNTVASGIISLVPSLIIAAMQLIIVLSVLLKYEPKLALVGVVVGPLGFLVTLIFRKQYTKYQKKLRETSSEYYSFFQEIISNLTVSKVFQLESVNENKFENLRRERIGLVLKSSKISVIMNSFMKLVYLGGYLVCFSYCAYLLSQNTVYANSGIIVSGAFTYGTMTLFLSLVNQIQGTISTIGSVVPRLYSMLVSTKRIREVTELGYEKYDGSSADIPRSTGININNMSFAYVQGKNILNNVNIKIEPNKTVGLIGKSGSGKTTLIRLLLSLVEPTRGTVEFYDENGKSEPASPDCRRFISYVPQGNTLLSGSIRFNLSVGCPEADDEQMMNALKIAGAYDFVQKLPDGLDTVLSEKAGGLSEGQAQRISIARAILKKGSVLIFDEATSALDEATEAQICEAVSKSVDKTRIIITHRKSMLKYCDSVIEIDENGNVRQVEAK